MTHDKILKFDDFRRCMTLVPNQSLIEIGQKYGITRKYSIMFIDFVYSVAQAVWTDKTGVNEIMVKWSHIFVDYKSIDESFMVTGFHLSTKGDRSVGIFPSEWTIDGQFSFEDEGELESFRGNLVTTWGHITDEPVIIETFEERAKQIDLEKQYERN